MQDENARPANGPSSDDPAALSIGHAGTGLASRRSFLATIRQLNLAAADSRPDEAQLRRLDSSLKRNTAFVRRLKTFAEPQSAAFFKDFMALNLTRYVAEMVNSICEAKLKPGDVPSVVQLCSMAHQRYADFSLLLFDYFKKAFAPNAGDGRLSNTRKFRTDLQLFVELLLVAIFGEREGVPVVLDALTVLTRGDKEDRFAGLPELIAFCRLCGQDVLMSSGDAGAEAEWLISAEARQRIRSKLQDYLDGLVRHFGRLCTDLAKAKQKVNHQLQNRGDVNPKCADQLNQLQQEFDRLQGAVADLSAILGQPFSLPSAADESSQASDHDLMADVPSEAGGSGDKPLWDSEETRMFYESYPNLEEMLPPILLVKRRNRKAGRSREAELEAMRALEREIAERADDDQTAEEALPMDADPAAPEPQMPPAADLSSSSSSADDDDEEEDDDNNEEGGGGDAAASLNASSASSCRLEMDAFLVKLPNLINRDMIDQAAIDFATSLNCKSNIKRLLRTLYEVQRSRLDLLPFYGRLVAILSPVIDGFGLELCRLLMAEFRRHLRKNDQVCVESKVKVVRYIGELVKFRIFGAEDAVCCFRLLLIDLNNHCIEMACNFLETCGHFLLHQPDVQLKMKGLLEVMKRRISCKVRLDARYELMVHNAYYACFPAESSTQTKAVQLTSMQKYIKNLLASLTMVNMDKTLKKLQKMDWADASLTQSLVSWLSQPYSFKFNASECFACLLSGLATDHPNFCQLVVDNVVEQIQLDMDVQAVSRMNHMRRRGCVSMLAQLYVYQMVGPELVVGTLYLLISGGDTVAVAMDEEQRFRALLVCELLHHCGEYFCRGDERRTLDTFLLFFQRYCWALADVEEMSRADFLQQRRANVDVGRVITLRQLLATVHSTIRAVRPRFQLATTVEEATTALHAEIAKYRDGQPAVSDVDDAAAPAPADGRMLVDDDDQREDEEDEVDDEELDEDDDDDEGTLTDGSEDGDSSDTEVGQSQQPGTDDEEGEDNDGDLEALQFSVELNHVINDMIQQRINEQPKAPTIAFHPPIVDQPLKSNDSEAIKFVLMVKGRQSKPILKTVEVPKDSDIALNFKSRAADELREKQKMKQLTLNMSKRIEEEETEDHSTSSTKLHSGVDWRKATTTTTMSSPSMSAAKSVRGVSVPRDALYSPGGGGW